MNTLRVSLIAAICCLAWGQSDGPLAFEVASVKRAAPVAPVVAGSMVSGGGGTAEIGHVTIPNISLKDLIKRAYGLKDYQVAGPDWMASERYSIAAKLPAGGTQDQVPQMLRTLLAERFKLQVHHEDRAVPIFALTVGKDGSKLKEGDETVLKAAAESNARVAKAMSTPGISGFLMTVAPGQMVAKNVPIPRLAEMLTRQLEPPVLDQSGLTGSYCFTLNWVPEDAAGNPIAASSETAPATEERVGLTLPAALQAQLGLKLEKRNSPADVLVVDRAEKIPTEN